MKIELHDLKRAIGKELAISLPGRDAQFKMAPKVRRMPEIPENEKKAAVLVLLYRDIESVKLCFIKRAEYEGPHSGQISFPGGIHEVSDLNLEATALRETAEETGVNSGDIEVLGSLSPITIPVSGVEVYPFCGTIPYPPKFEPDPVEVQYILSVPLEEFFNSDCLRQEKWELGEFLTEVPFYFFEDHKIWGATAMILSEFLEIILRSGLYQPAR